MRPLTLLPIIAFGAVRAQPVLESAELHLIGNMYDLYQVVTPGSSDPNPEGEGVTWDYTSASLDLMGAGIFLAPSATPFGGDYPTADVALEVISLSGTSYNYYDLTSGYFDLLGQAIGSTDPIVYTDAKRQFQFPFTYGASFTDDYVVDGSTYSITRAYTGWGTLDIVTGTFDYVVKLTSSNGGLAFFRTSPIEPLMSIEEDGTTIVWDRVPIGIREAWATAPLRPFPNPTASAVHIEGLAGATTCTVADAQGRTLISEHLFTASGTIDLSRLEPGNYLITVQDRSGRRSARVVRN